MDVSSRVADVLDFKYAGTAKIKVEYVGPAPLEGSDDSTLLASLRTNGTPATIDGPPSGRRPMVAVGGAASPPPSLVKPPRRRRRRPTGARPFARRAAPNPKLLKAPPPPPRPFDLGEIARVIGPGPAAPAVPPRRPVRAGPGRRPGPLFRRERRRRGSPAAARPFRRADRARRSASIRGVPSRTIGSAAAKPRAIVDLSSNAMQEQGARRVSFAAPMRIGLACSPLRPGVVRDLLGFVLPLAPSRAQSFQTAAPFALLVDFESGAVLFEKNADAGVGAGRDRQAA